MIIQKGQKVSTSLYGRGVGVVVDIIGEQNPETCKNVFDGIGVAGGNADFIIIFDDATRARIPETLLRKSMQWKILDGVASEFEIALLIKKNKQFEAEQKEKESRRLEEKKAELERLALKYKHLKRSSNDECKTVTAAKNIRSELKAAFPKTKFSVRKEHYGTINVSWINGPTVDQVEAITGKYEEGHFNGMDDIYEYRDNSFSDLFGGAKYLFTHRDYSPDVWGAKKTELESKTGMSLDYENEREFHQHFNIWPSVMIRRELALIEL